jgi:hypothetical protein
MMIVSEPPPAAEMRQRMSHAERRHHAITDASRADMPEDTG